jgi:tritrans,polycis-undecaprenyl-diphosphate synthase [geranylgeranyl-diphosphate specific]
MLGSIAFIPDGNRRFAQKAHLPLAAAYQAGFDKARDVWTWSLDAGVKETTVWALSTENLQRNPLELGVFMRLLDSKLNGLLHDKTIEENGVRVNIVGRLSLLPKRVQETVAKIHSATKDNASHVANICLGYGGRAEIVDAVNSLVAKRTPITEQSLSQALYTASEPDLIVRTGGTQRLSGFMPWQSTYSELYFSEKLWPEFSRGDFDAAIADYESRARRYGK